MAMAFLCVMFFSQLLLSPVFSSLLFACCCVFLARSSSRFFVCLIFFSVTHTTAFFIAEKKYSCLALVSVAAGLGLGALFCYVVESLRARTAVLSLPMKGRRLS